MSGSIIDKNSLNSRQVKNGMFNFIKTNRGGKITFHGPGQLIFYFIIDLKKRNINIRKLISSIEKTIIDTLSYFKIKSFELILLRT